MRLGDFLTFSIRIQHKANVKAEKQRAREAMQRQLFAMKRNRGAVFVAASYNYPSIAFRLYVRF